MGCHKNPHTNRRLILHNAFDFNARLNRFWLKRVYISVTDVTLNTKQKHGKHSHSLNDCSYHVHSWTVLSKQKHLSPSHNVKILYCVIIDMKAKSQSHHVFYDVNAFYIHLNIYLTLQKEMTSLIFTKKFTF